MDEDDFLIVIRPSDLATLRIVTVNLEMDGTKIRRSTPGETAAVMILLPPQHFREHPQSATDDVLASTVVRAVKQWRFKPYLQAGQPVETEARITVNFTISTY